MELMKNFKSHDIFFQKSEEIMINYNISGISSKKGYFQAYQFYKSRKYTRTNIFITLVIILSRIYHYPFDYLRRLKNILFN